VQNRRFRPAQDKQATQENKYGKSKMDQNDNVGEETISHGKSRLSARSFSAKLQPEPGVCVPASAKTGPAAVRN
jgi:hypothetical protein